MDNANNEVTLKGMSTCRYKKDETRRIEAARDYTRVANRNKRYWCCRDVRNEKYILYENQRISRMIQSGRAYPRQILDAHR